MIERLKTVARAFCPQPLFRSPSVSDSFPVLVWLRAGCPGHGTCQLISPLRRLLPALLGILLFPGSLHAAPAWMRELTPAKPGSFTAPAPTTLDLRVSWKGLLDAGHLRLEVAPKDADKPGRLVVRSSAASRGPASALFPYRSDFWSEIDPASLRPLYFHAVESDRRETVTTTSRFAPDQVQSEEICRPFDRRKPTTRKTSTFRQPVVFDIFSAMLHVRSQRLQAGDRITMLVHPFDKPYLARVKVAAREAHLGRPCIRLLVEMQKIDPKSLELRPYRKLKRPATLWLSDDARRMPVEFRAAVFIGDVRATLAKDF